MSSLQALLDAQDQRRGGSSSRIRGGGRGDNKYSQNSRQAPPSQREPSWSARNGSKTKDGEGSSRRDQGISSSSSSRWGNLSSPRDNNRAKNIASSKSSAEPTYEERRANIERRAIEDSRGADARATVSNEDDIESLSSWVGPLIDGERCTYYQDRDKRYPFYTDTVGHALLRQLMETNRGLLRLNHEMLEEKAASVADNDDGTIGEYDAKDVIIRIGQGLYAHKPTLRTRGVTWSTEEYGHPGLQRMYLRMKSIQRFTEIWCLLERSAALGVFDRAFENNQTSGNNNVLRIAAVGGGPGYELLATELFFAQRAPWIELELISMDLCPAWRPYVERLGYRFVQYDINATEGGGDNDDPLLRAAGLGRGELHFCIVSCVMIYCTNEPVLNMFRRLVQRREEDGGGGGVRAILVSERGERTTACTMMEDLGGRVVRLIDQSNGMDERQAIWCSREFGEEELRAETFSSADYEAHQNESVFPNVPYCEHKERRSGGGGSGRSGRQHSTQWNDSSRR